MQFSNFQQIPVQSYQEKSLAWWCTSWNTFPKFSATTISIRNVQWKYNECLYRQQFLGSCDSYLLLNLFNKFLSLSSSHAPSAWNGIHYGSISNLLDKIQPPKFQNMFRFPVKQNRASTVNVSCVVNLSTLVTSDSTTCIKYQRAEFAVWNVVCYCHVVRFH